MIQGLHHIAIIVSSEESLGFYGKLGFRETQRFIREKDTIVFMDAYGMVLEIFIDPTRPTRVTDPEAMGLRHLALKVDDVKKTLAELGMDAEEIRQVNGKHFTFFKDPDGLPIELHE